MGQVSYVAGFLFTRTRDRVVLIAKHKPAWQAGQRNGVGGKVEPGETPEAAMVREFEEEAGVHFEDWKLGVVLTRPGIYQVHFFYGFSDLALQVRSMEREPVGIYDAILFDRLKVIPNLRWLIPFMLDPNSAKPISVEDIAGH